MFHNTEEELEEENKNGEGCSNDSNNPTDRDNGDGDGDDDDSAEDEGENFDAALMHEDFTRSHPKLRRAEPLVDSLDVESMQVTGLPASPLPQVNCLFLFPIYLYNRETK